MATFVYTFLMYHLRADCPAHLIVLSVRRVQLNREPDGSLTPYGAYFYIIQRP